MGLGSSCNGLKMSGAAALSHWSFFEAKRGRKGGLPPSWHARVAVCSKCGGVIDEITFAEHALGDKKSVMVYPDEYAPLLRGCGTIWDWL